MGYNILKLVTAGNLDLLSRYGRGCSDRPETHDDFLLREGSGSGEGSCGITGQGH